MIYEKKMKEKANRRKSEVNNALRVSQDYQIGHNGVKNLIAPIVKTNKGVKKVHNHFDVTALPAEFINPNSH
jgi:hypothetical protein